jgi:hypothetical protein
VRLDAGHAAEHVFVSPVCEPGNAAHGLVYLSL